MLLELVLVGTISPAIITTEYCTKQKDTAEYIVKTSEGIPEDYMRKLFPRHTHIIYEIYSSKYPRAVPTKVYKNCMRDAPV
jgi:hypothetical protein